VLLTDRACQVFHFQSCIYLNLTSLWKIRDPSFCLCVPMIIHIGLISQAILTMMFPFRQWENLIIHEKVNMKDFRMASSRLGTTRESRARSFPLAKVFSEVSSLLGTSGEAERLGVSISVCSFRFFWCPK